MLGLLLASAAAAAPPLVRHSGTVVSVDPARGMLVLAEVRPWRVDRDGIAVTPRTIVLTPATKVDTFIRVNAPGAYAGDFIEVALDAADVSPGDVVTVEYRHEVGRLVALRVTVAELN